MLSDTLLYTTTHAEQMPLKFDAALLLLCCMATEWQHNGIGRETAMLLL
jgi:hypothetical protein